MYKIYIRETYTRQHRGKISIPAITRKHKPGNVETVDWSTVLKIREATVEEMISTLANTAKRLPIFKAR